MAGLERQDPRRRPLLGCIADDVTGATDMAINLVQGGMGVVQLFDTPSAVELAEIDADAVVVGLQTRSIPQGEAVTQSVQCLNAFRQAGLERYFFKYCSTFDSTHQGNIGPVAAALLDELNAKQTIFCPAFPRNGRTVYQGHLFVHDRLLNESGMEKHPLNPMTDANLVRFLGRQCDRNVGLLNFADVDDRRVEDRLAELETQGRPFVVTDVCNDAHLEIIAAAVAHMPLVTGGSGIGRFLPMAYRNLGLLRTAPYVAQLPRATGRSLIVSGSCSSATNKQVAWMRGKIPCWQLNIDEVIRDLPTARREVMHWARAGGSNSPVLIYSTAPPSQVAAVQREHGAQVAARAIEDFLSEVTASLVAELDVSRLVIAGGETAGAVVKGLGVRAVRIGPEICAGVPWTESIGERPLALALKSGNFGAEDFFEQALRMLP